MVSMEQAIREQYNKRIFNELIEKYGVQRNFIEPLGGFENFVYQYRKENQEFILRISHTGLRRTKEQLHAEADFINYLAEHGISVARPVASPMGNLVETADNENPSFSAVSFEKAKGRAPEREHWTHSFCQSYGRLMGRIHFLTKDYQPSNPLYRRPDGVADLNGFAEKFLPSSESGSKRELQVSIRRYLKDFDVPKDVIVVSPEELAEKRFLNGYIYQSALSEGKVLFV
jgi:Ser/Thr protein kinase RdoA (MazF antagonist)